MRDIIVFVVITVLSSVNLFSQVTNFNDSFGGGNKETCVRMKSVEIRSDGVVVTIEKKALKALKRLIIFQSDNTFIEYLPVFITAFLKVFFNLIIHMNVQSPSHNTDSHYMP